MKLLFCHPSHSLLRRLLDRPLAGHSLVVPCPQATNLIPVAAATEPHLIVLGAETQGTFPQALQSSLRQAGFYAPVVILTSAHPSDQELDDIWRQLQISNRKLSRPQFDAQSYTVMTEKLDKPRRSERVVAPKDLAAQENRFLALLASGALCHQRAKAYQRTAAATEHYLASDWALATLSGEGRAYLWRTQLFRHASVLAHYIPGVEVECLPLPHPPSSKLDYLYNALSGEALYALCAIRAFGIDPGCERTLWKLGQIQTAQESNCSDVCTRLAGWSGLMRQVAAAHVHVLDTCLSGSSAMENVPQESHRSRCRQQIFCRWWKFTGFLTSPESLGRLSEEFHSGRRAVGVPSFDSFFEFAEQIQQGVQPEANN